MARRRRQDGEVNLDSLMDALTNVVAVLILVLMLVQIDVVKVVVELSEDLEPASEEMIKEKLIVLKKLEEQKKSIEEQEKEDPPTPEELEEEQRNLALLEKKLQDQQNLLASKNELIELEKKEKEKRDTEKEETEKMQEEIAQLEAALDETPTLEAIPPVEVTIPNSRPIPEKANKYFAICTDKAVHFIDPFTPTEIFYEELDDNKKKWFIERIEQEGKDRQVYDQEKISAYFKDYDFKNSRSQGIEIVTVPHYSRLQLRVAPDIEEGGTPFAALSEADNPFHQICKKLSRDKDNILFFKVHPKGFNTYLQARKIADSEKIPCGWEVSGNNALQLVIPETYVKPIAEPPPKKPSTGPEKPRPPRLDQKLD